jgi:alkaline phosphatase D
VDEFLGRYRDAFSQHYLRQLMSRIPTYMTLDDHEIEDNWPTKANERDMMVKYPAAMHAYQVYQLSHSPLLKVDNDRLAGTPDSLYYDFADGCSEYFVMDSRTEREPEEGAAAGEMIGEQQMSDLLAWLGNDSGRVKFVVTSVPFFPDQKKANEDKWSGFRRQRDKIISFIRQNRVRKVVFLSGDVHCSMASELDISGTGEDPLFIYSIISSAFYWPYPHEKRRQFRLTGYVASADDEKAYELGQSSDVFSGDNFTRVSVNKDLIGIDVFERKGEHVYHMEYDF